MSVALLLGSGQMFAQQAAVSAALVATLQPPDGGVEFARAVDALVGGSVALAVSALVLPAHPARMVREAAAPGAGRARRRARRRRGGARGPRPRGAPRPRWGAGAAIDELARNLDDALVVGRETALLAPPRRRTLGTVDLYADAAAQIDLAVRNVRVLARGARRAIDLDENVPPGDGRRAARARRRGARAARRRSTTRRARTRSASRRCAPRARRRSCSSAPATSRSPSSSARSARRPSTCCAGRDVLRGRGRRGARGGAGGGGRGGAYGRRVTSGGVAAGAPRAIARRSPGSAGCRGVLRACAAERRTPACRRVSASSARPAATCTGRSTFPAHTRDDPTVAPRVYPP